MLRFRPTTALNSSGRRCPRRWLREALRGARTFEKRSSALCAAIGFTRVRRLAVFILNYRRPVSGDHRLHHLGKSSPIMFVLPVVWNSPPRVAGASNIKVASCVTRESWRPVHRAGISFTRRRIHVAITRVSTRLPVVCSRPSAICRTPLEWKQTSVWLAGLLSTGS